MSANTDAIKAYFDRTPAMTPQAQAIKTDFYSWLSGSWFPSDDEASKRRSLYDAANNTPESLDTAADITPKAAAEKMAVIQASPILTTSQKANAAKASPVAAAAATSGAATHKTIRQGSTGTDVKIWQAFLGVNSDGNFGPMTKSATMKWQGSNGLTADGVVGPMTWAKAFPPPAVKQDNASPFSTPAAPPIAMAPQTPTPSILSNAVSMLSPAKSAPKQAAAAMFSPATPPAPNFAPSVKPQPVLVTPAPVTVSPAASLNIHNWTLGEKIGAAFAAVATFALGVFGIHHIVKK